MKEERLKDYECKDAIKWAEEMAESGFADDISQDDVVDFSIGENEKRLSEIGDTLCDGFAKRLSENDKVMLIMNPDNEKQREDVALEYIDTFWREDMLTAFLHKRYEMLKRN